MSSYDSWKTRSDIDDLYHRQPYLDARCIECDSDRDLRENEYGEFICESCEENAAERAWERHCEAFHDGGAVSFKSLQQQQIEARRLK